MRLCSCVVFVGNKVGIISENDECCFILCKLYIFCVICIDVSYRGSLVMFDNCLILV